MQHIRLTHLELDFWIDARLREFEGRWLAVADLADEPDVGTSEDAREALRGALMRPRSTTPGMRAASGPSPKPPWEVCDQGCDPSGRTP